MTVIEAEVAIIGGGVGGVAAALAALRSGHRVVMSERYAWLGGQLTSQAVPPDEHSWVEQFGVTASYRALRQLIRRIYREGYPLTPEARRWEQLNPGSGHVSRLCHEPQIAKQAIDLLLAPHIASGRLTVLQPFRPVDAEAEGDRIVSVVLRDEQTGDTTTVLAEYILDATETGDILPLAGVEHVTGFESQLVTGEPSAPTVAEPLNMQAISHCFAVDHVDGDHTIDKPEMYDFWRSYHPAAWGGSLLQWSAPDPKTMELVPRTFTPNDSVDTIDNADYHKTNTGDRELWQFRRILARGNFMPGTFESDLVLVNWPQIDYFLHPVFDVPDADRNLWEAKQLSLSMLYWMQTEAPRPDGGHGYPGLRLRADVVGTRDGLAQAPYIRESRRIEAEYRVCEQDIALSIRGSRGARKYVDTVGVGMYRIDLHPSTGGDGYIDIGCCPFQIPLGALIPIRVENLLPACKNLGTTHITNGCFRLHPVEWNIGEVAGELAAYCLETGHSPRHVRGEPRILSDFQSRLEARGVELDWPRIAGY